MAVVFEGAGKARKPKLGPCLSLDLPPAERGAGWERSIAPSVLKEVEVVQTFLSDDAHTIGLPPRTTQPSVGRFVREVKHYRDASYGSHFGLYGGVNLLPVFGERMKTVPTVPRTHHHFGTGVNTGFQDVRLHPTVLELKAISCRADWVPAPSLASAKVVELAKPTEKYPQVRQALFPFPTDPAGNSCPSAPPPPTPVQTSPPPPPPCEQTQLALPMSSLMWPTPFWYNGSLSRPGKPVGEANDYDFCKLKKASGPSTVVEQMELTDPNFYIPGQVAASDEDNTPEPTTELIQEQSPVQNNRQPQPLYKRRIMPLRPPQEHYQLSPWIGQDTKALKRVGLAFQTDVCKGHYTRYPPGPQPAITQRRCDYPDMKLSVL